jgi:hypothetical protein
MAEPPSAAPSTRTKPLTYGLFALAGVGVVALGVLIARELAPHHATTHARASAASEVVADEAPVAAPQPVAPAPVAPAPPKARGDAAPAPAAHADGLVRVRALASIIKEPESVPTDGVFHNRISGMDHYSYESFGPYRRGELRRDANHPDAWQVDGSNGVGKSTNVEDIAPPGGTRPAATVRDEKGNVVSQWVEIEAGPLAPAYATMMANGGTRIVSKAYLQENRAQFPQELASLVDR